jgi:hypothetical protein
MVFRRNDIGWIAACVWPAGAKAEDIVANAIFKVKEPDIIVENIRTKRIPRDLGDL